MIPTIRHATVLAALCAPTAFAQLAHPGALTVGEARSAFLETNPGTGLFINDHGTLTRVYGNAFSQGANPVASANAFVAEHARLWGADASQLLPIGPWDGGEHLLPLMWDEATQTNTFSLVGYTQAVHGVPVFRSSLRVLVRNEAGFPAVLASSDLKDLGAFPETVKGALALAARLDPASYAARLPKALREQAAGVPAELVVWAGTDDMKVAPRLAAKFIVDRGVSGDNDFARLLYLTDPATGEVFFEEDQVCYADVTGTSSGMATPGNTADACVAEVSMPMPYARAWVGSTVVYADSHGVFTIPNQSGTVTLGTSLAGRWFTTFNVAAGNATLSMTNSATAGTPASMLLNAANTAEADRAAVNAYLHANKARDFALAYLPTYPGIGTQTAWPVNVQVSGTCNAYYDGSSINFYPAAGGCNNTAFSTIVHHEYGHHLVAMAGSGQGAYGEGMGDCMSLLLADDPVLAIGFQSCSAGIRNADNTCTYSSSGCSSCGSEIHACGQLISGCVWDVRQNLIAGLGSAGALNRTSQLAVNSMPLHTGTTIAGDITIDYLTLDDNDGNISNGTPNYYGINQAFSAHGLPGPALSLLDFTFPNGLPTTVSPNGTTSIAVQVNPIAGLPLAGSGTFYWRNGTSGSFTSVPMTQGASNQYSVAVPSSVCPSTVQFYFTASTTSSVVVSYPSAGATAPLSAMSATGVDQLSADSMETNTGWVAGATGDTATTGLWTRVDPNGTAAQPEDDHGTGTMCWVTGQGTVGGSAGTQDVDGGTTTLTSPVFSLAGYSDGIVSYARWYSNDTGAAPNADSWPIEISNDNGATWVQLELVTENLNAWAVKSFRVRDFVTPSTTMKVRFLARDQSSGSIIEAGVDDFSVQGIDCTASNPADIDGDGMVDGADLGALLAGWGTASPDLDGSGAVDGSDLGLLLAAWGS